MIELSPSVVSTMPIATASAILLAGVVDDLRSRKFHNWLFLTCAGIAAIVAILTGGLSSLLFAVTGFAAGIVILLPLVLVKVIGAGDMKLLAAFGIVAGWNAVVSVAVFGMIWGAIFGVTKVIVSGQGRVLAMNLMSIVTLKERSTLELHRIPFTVAILMGWLTHLVYVRAL